MIQNVALDQSKGLILSCVQNKIHTHSFNAQAIRNEQTARSSKTLLLLLHLQQVIYLKLHERDGHFARTVNFT
jgi:hypothetical protein